MPVILLIHEAIVQAIHIGDSRGKGLGMGRSVFHRVVECRPALAMLCVTSVIAVGVVDYLSGRVLTLAFFYLMAVAVAAWWGSRRCGLFLAFFASTILSSISALEVGADWSILAANCVLRLSLFSLVAVLIANHRRMLASLTQAVQEQAEALTAEINEHRHLQGELLKIEECEQRRIGRDLHDVLGGDLTGIGFMVRGLHSRLEAKAAAESADAMEVANYVAETIGRVRSLARGLNPVEMSEEGLMAGLRGLARDTAKVFGISCELRCDSAAQVHDGSVGLHLYRITQESISNAIKHGKASKIDIHLASAGDLVVLTVQDNGCGLPADTQSGGMGLRVMEHRANSIGGSLRLERMGPCGTRVVCTVPIKTPQPAEELPAVVAGSAS